VLRSRGVNGVPTIALLVALLVLTACGSSTAPPPSSKSTHITAAVGGSVSLDKARIDIPKDALSVDSTVTIERIGAPKDLSGTSLAYAFRVNPALELRGPVTLHLPAAGSMQTDAATGGSYLAYQDTDGTWVTVPGVLNPDGTVSAQVEHLSNWLSLDPVAWLKGIVSALLKKLEGPLAPAAPCPDQLPVVAISNLPAQAPLSICVHATSPGHATVTVRNRRQFALAITPDGFAGPVSTGPLRPLGPVGPSSFMDLPSSGTIDLDYTLTQNPTAISYKPDEAYSLIEQLWPMLLGGAIGADVPGQADLLAGQGVIDCVHRAAPPGSGMTAAGLAFADCEAQAVVKKTSGLTKIGNLSMSRNAVLDILKHILPYQAIVAMGMGDASGKVTIQAQATQLPPSGNGNPPQPTPQQAPKLTAPPDVPKRPTIPPAIPPPPPPSVAQPKMIKFYDCANDHSNHGIPVSAGKRWGNNFTASGTLITGGWVLVGAADSGTHDARIGIFDGPGPTLGTPLAEVDIPVSGYAGQNFTFPSPAHVTPGQALYFAVIATDGDFTAYDQAPADGCFIGRLDGYQ